jgi:hypothetical protein
LETSNEDIDAFELLSDGRLVVSTSGSLSVTGPGGTTLSGADEDLIVLTPLVAGNYSAGTWAMYFDGSDVGLSVNSGDIDGVDISTTGDIYLSMREIFSVTGVAGDDEDVFICRPSSIGPSTACTFLPNLFDGSQWGLSANDIDAIDITGN